MNRPLNKIAEWQEVTPSVFKQDILPLARPAVLKGVVNHWPSVKAAKKGHKDFHYYLSEHYAGGNMLCARMAAKEQGLFFYNQDMTDFNFKREVMSFDTFFRDLFGNIDRGLGEVVALQSAAMHEYFPTFEKENQLTLFDDDVRPRVWVGNDSTVNAHYDDAENIACVLSGKRRFTLFPPEQLENLYIGPLEFTPAGAPMSLVDFSKPDFNKYPKFKTALDHALVAELEPGDAIYIPSLWWHHVHSYGGLNALANYWQGGSIGSSKKPIPADSILLGILAIRDLPAEQKKAWKGLLDYYVFSDQKDKFDHIPEHIRGILSPLSEQQRAQLKKWLGNQMK